MDLTGAELGVFEVWGPIGEGGMSRVWLGRHRELSNPVVIKTLLDTEAGSEAFTRLLDEARIMARVPSGRVVRAVDAGVHQGHPYIAQEYVDGLDLAELDHRRRATLGLGLPLWFVCQAMHEVAEALQSAHQTGVLHRDVKPSNLLGSPQMGTHLGDFGIATARRVEEKTRYGTVRFISPEALRGETPTRRCDVYSLGATGYDLRYGEPPFPGVNDILGTTPLRFPAPATAEEAYFQHVLARMLERDAEKRFSSLSTPRRLLEALARTLHPTFHGIRLHRGGYQIGPVRISCTTGDIADAEADAIVCSANDEMKMRSGVGEALRTRGGAAIEEEAMKEGRRALGECVPTTGGALACRHVLHAVSAWKQASCIARTSQRVFLLAEELGLRSLAIPALGTGAAQIVPEASACAVGSALLQHLHHGGSRQPEVRFVHNHQPTREAVNEVLDDLFLRDADAVDCAAAPRADDRITTDETLYLPIVEPR